MAVNIVAGALFNSVTFGTASGTGNGYIIGTTPIEEMLRVDRAKNAAALIGVKYSHHRDGDPRSGDRPPDAFVRMTMLVHGGPWQQRIWREHTGESVEFRLERPGDFIAWEPGLHHSWIPGGQSTMLTVTFERSKKRRWIWVAGLLIFLKLVFARRRRRLPDRSPTSRRVSTELSVDLSGHARNSENLSP